MITATGNKTENYIEDPRDLVLVRTFWLRVLSEAWKGRVPSQSSLQGTNFERRLMTARAREVTQLLKHPDLKSSTRKNYQ